MGFTIPEDRFYKLPLLVANPAAGLACSVIPAAGTIYRIMAGSFILTTGVAVANRVVRIDFWDGMATWGGFISNVPQAASLAYTYIFMIGYTGGGHLQESIIQIPWSENVWINFIHYLRITAVNLQGADQFSAFRFTIEQTIDDLA